MRFFLVFLFSVFCIGCNTRSGILEATDEGMKLARVGDEYLHISDLSFYFKNKKITSSDSLNLLNRLVNNWIEKQLLVEKKEELLEKTKAEIAYKVDKYQNELIAFELKKKLMPPQDSIITDYDIQNFYKKNSSLFTLNEHLIKCKYLVIDTKEKNKRKLQTLFFSPKEKDQQLLQKICDDKGLNAYLNADEWVKFNFIIRNTPLREPRNQSLFIIKTKKYISKYGENLLFFSIFDRRLKGRLAPLEFIKDEIITLILQQRMKTSEQQFSKELLKEAKKNNEIEIY